MHKPARVGAKGEQSSAGQKKPISVYVGEWASAGVWVAQGCGLAGSGVSWWDAWVGQERGMDSQVLCTRLEKGRCLCWTNHETSTRGFILHTTHMVFAAASAITSRYSASGSNTSPAAGAACGNSYPQLQSLHQQRPPTSATHSSRFVAHYRRAVVTHFGNELHFMHAFPLVFGSTNSMVWGSARQCSWRQHRGSQAALEVCPQDGCVPRPLQSALLGRAAPTPARELERDVQ